MTTDQPAGDATAPAQPSATHQPAQAPAQHAFVPYQQYAAGQGQQYQANGYNGYYHGAYAPVAYPQAIPSPEVQEPKIWVYFKAGMHALAFVICICALGMGLSFAPGEDAYLAAITAPVPVMGLVWSGAELIFGAVHKFKKSIHPGGQVAATLILWMAATIVGGLESAVAAISSSYCSSHRHSDSYGYYRDPGCNDTLGGNRPLFLAIAVLTCILASMYFLLFVWACMDTHKRNAARRAIMVLNPPTAYWGPAAQGWQSMPQSNDVQRAEAPADCQPPIPAAVPGQHQPPAQGGQPLAPGHDAPQATSPEQMNEKGSAEVSSSSQQNQQSSIREFYTPNAS